MPICRQPRSIPTWTGITSGAYTDSFTLGLDRVDRFRGPMDTGRRPRDKAGDVRNLLAVMVLAGCGPSLPVGSNGPGPVEGPVLRDLGPSRGMAARRLQIELPTPGYVLVITGHGRARLEAAALSVAADREFPAGRHQVIALLGSGGQVGFAPTACSYPVLYMQAAFPGPSGHLPLAALSDPPLPAASGPTPVIRYEQESHGCWSRSLARQSQLYLLVARDPIGPRIAQAAIDAIPPGTSAPEAVRLLAGALRASLTLPR